MPLVLVTDSPAESEERVATAADFEQETWREIVRRLELIRTGEAELISNEEVLAELRRDFPRLANLAEAIDQRLSE